MSVLRGKKIIQMPRSGRGDQDGLLGGGSEGTGT